MKTTALSCLLALSFSLTSFAQTLKSDGPGNLVCDLSVKRLSDRVISSSKVSGTFHMDQQDYSINSAAQILINIYEDTPRIKVTKNENSVLKDCRIVNAQYLETEEVTNAGTPHLSCSQLPGAGCTPKQHFKLTQECNLVEYEVLSAEERQEAICQKAIDCSKNIKTRRQAKEHKALVNELCNNR